MSRHLILSSQSQKDSTPILINRFFTAVAMAALAVTLLASCGNSGDEDPGTDGDVDGDSDPIRVQPCDSELQEPTESWFIGEQKFTIEGEDTEISIARQPGNENAIGETFPFHLIRFTLKDAENDICISDLDALSYTWGHHNWDELLEIVDGDVRYIIRMKFKGIFADGDSNPEDSWEDSIQAVDADSGDTIWGPENLIDAGCRTLPPGNLNECVGRDRTDS